MNIWIIVAIAAGIGIGALCVLVSYYIGVEVGANLMSDEDKL